MLIDTGGLLLSRCTRNVRHGGVIFPMRFTAPCWLHAVQAAARIVVGPDWCLAICCAHMLWLSAAWTRRELAVGQK